MFVVLARRNTCALILLASVSLSGCSVLLGGNDNPRPDAADQVQPAVPEGAATWSGLDWEPVSFEKPKVESIEQWDQATAVTVGPGGWVAVGSNSDVMGYVGRIWQSSDSLDWGLVNEDLLAGLELVDVAATTDEFVAIGTESSDPNAPVTSILRSTDGATWSEVKRIPDAWAYKVASSGSGFAVIVQTGAVTSLWFSPDGITWDPGAPPSGEEVWLADIAWDVDEWLAVGGQGHRALLVRSVDGSTWVEDRLPASEPVEGVIDVSAYQVVPGRWATLVLGIDHGPSCAEDDDWCDKYQVAWSRTEATGWQRLPKDSWMLGRGFGVEAVEAGDAGFVSFGSEIRTSADGWEWTKVAADIQDGFVDDAVISGDRVVAVGPSMAEADLLEGWFGSGVVRP